MNPLASIPVLIATSLLLGSPVAAVASSGLPCGYETTVISPPDISGWDEDLRLRDINDAGVAAGYVELLDPLPCTWSAEQGVNLLPMPPGAIFGRAVAINNNGWILVNVQKTTGRRGYVYVPDGTGNYATIEIVPASPVMSEALGINDKNQVVGFQSMGTRGEPSFPEGGFLWSLEAGKVNIQLPGWTSCRCIGINDDGVICGNASQSIVADEGVDSVRAFVLDCDSVVVVQPTPPFNTTLASTITSTGLLGGNMGSTVGAGAAGFVLNTGAGALDVWPVPPGYFAWVLRDLNAVGIAAGELLDADWFSNGVEYPCSGAKGQVHDLSSMLPPELVGTAWGIVAIRDDGTLLGKCVVECTILYEPLSGFADLDCDGRVDAADLAMMLTAWGSDDAAADVDGDGAVDGADLGLLLGAWSM